MPNKLQFFRILPLYLMAIALPVSVSAGGVAAGLLLLVTIALLIADPQAKKFIPLPVFGALLLFMLAYALSTAFAAPYPTNWHKWVEELWLKTLLFTVPVVVGVHRQHALRVLKVSLVIASLTAIYAIWQHFSGLDLVRGRSLMTEFGHNEVVGFFGHKLSYGGQLLIYLLLVSGMIIYGSDEQKKWFWSFCGMLLATALLWSHARSPMLGVLVGCLVFVLAQIGRRRLISLGILLLPILALVSVPTLQHHFRRAFSVSRNITRIHLWESSLAAIKARPLLGFGPGNFGNMMTKYEVDGFYNTRAHSHNDFLMHGVNGGLLGLFLALVLIAVVTTLLWRLWKSGSQHAWVGLTAVAIQTGICTAGLFQVYQTDDEVEMLLYFVFGCALALQRKPSTGADQEKGDSNLS